MAIRTADNNKGKTNNKNTGLIVTLTGELENVYVGKKFAYANLKIYQSNGYYMIITVKCDLNFDFVNDGEIQTIKVEICKYKDTYVFNAV